MIPKLIHYCWFGKSPKPNLVEQCIASWKEILPDFKIMCWDESNVDLNHPFLKKAYKEKQWAFVADFIRLQKLIEFGGVYLDTDMMLIKTFNPLMNQKAFIGLESERYISCGVIGAIPKHPYILRCYQYYDNLVLDKKFTYKSIIIPKIFTKIYIDYFFVKEQALIPFQHENLLVCPVDCFYPFPNENLDTKLYVNYIIDSTYAVHLWHKSWKKVTALNYMRHGKYFMSFKTLFVELLKNENHLNKAYLKKIASAFKRKLFHE